MEPRAVLCVAALPAGVDAEHTEGLIKQPRDLVIGPHVARGRADTAGHRFMEPDSAPPRPAVNPAGHLPH
jgi:hypothetical protein